MTDTQKVPDELSVDSSPLELTHLSDEELMIIFEIERRLSEARTLKDDPEPSRASEQSSREGYLARVEERYPRVLLLDGGRGTGKTSILLTLVKRWSVAAGLWDGAGAHPDTDLDNRITRLRAIHPWIPEEGKSPDYVRVVPILDFDPLPAEMPLIAGVIQAWRLLAERYGSSSKRDHICDDGDDTLLDIWHTLFRVAAVGWTAIPKQSGLIEQVLDQEEQVRDWQRLDKQWRHFVNAALQRGKCLGDRDKLDDNPVFVIMIDDVDLQVGRIRELLPALRMLYHPRVFFLVAADRRHMIDMLKLDFLGKQNDLARHTNAQHSPAIDLAALDRWASDLAESAFEKVFPLRNRWTLKRLDLLEFLAFRWRQANTPGAQGDGNISFLSILDQIERRSQKTDDEGLAEVRGAGTFIRKLGEAAESKLPGVITYRAVHQLREYVKGISKSRPVEVLARLLSGNGDALAATIQDDLDRQGISRAVKTRGVQDKADAQLHNAETAPSGPDTDRADAQLRESKDAGVEEAVQASRVEDTRIRTIQSQVDVPITGQLLALYRAGPTELAGDYNIVLSARPDFVFTGSAVTVPTRMSTTDNRFNFTAALTAIALQDAGFPVDATGIRWDTYLSLAWTEWPEQGLSFAWTRHVHPRPDQLFEQTNSWAKFLRVELEPDDKLERFAYSWIFHQRCWAERKANVANPTGWTADSTVEWRRLLRFRNLNNDKLKRDNGLWLCRTLPLLARPEIGFPPDVQRLLLRHVLKSDVNAKLYLKRQRRRLVADAYVAAEAQRGRVVGTLPDGKKIEGWITTIDKSYQEAHSDPSPWSKIEETVDPSDT